MATAWDNSVSSEYNEIRELVNKPLRRGDIWYLIDERWFCNWGIYCSSEHANGLNELVDVDNPGPIDNSRLFNQNYLGGYELKRDLRAELDFISVPAEAWTKLRDRFGVKAVVPVIARHVVVESNEYVNGEFVPLLNIEYHPLLFLVCLGGKESIKRKLEISRINTVDGLLTKIRQMFNLKPSHNLRVYIKDGERSYKYLSCPTDVYLGESGLRDEDVLVVDMPNRHGTWNVDEKKFFVREHVEDDVKWSVLTKNRHECPVCRDTYKEPKSLPCGHSLCTECCVGLNLGKTSIVCPVCRCPAKSSATNLPINYALREILQDCVKNLDVPKIAFVCYQCKKRMLDNDSWHCSDCRVITCSGCVVRHHKYHKLRELTPLVKDRTVQLKAFRDRWAKIESDNYCGELVVHQLTTIANTMNNAELLKLIPKMKSAADDLKRKLIKLKNSFDDMNAIALVIAEVDGREESSLDRLNSELSNLKEKEKLVMKKENEIAEINKKYGNDLVRATMEFINVAL